MSSSTHISRQPYRIRKSDRINKQGHLPCIVWFTGLSGSGKSTLANSLEQALFEHGIRTYVLDGDNIRYGLNNNVDFSPEGRRENIRRIGEVAKLFVDAGVVVITAFISPYRDDRNRVRALVDAGEFVEVFVDCPIEVCESRDVKGLYKKARAGEISDFTGISAPFESPENPEISIRSDLKSVDEATGILLEYLLKRIQLPNDSI
jgi:adenylylsulfate kinase